MNFLFTTTKTSKKPFIKRFSTLTLLLGSVFVFLGITTINAKAENDSFSRMASKSHPLNTPFLLKEDFEIVRVKAYNESVEGNKDGSFVIFLNDKKAEEETRILYKVSFQDAKTNEVITRENLRNPLKVTELAPGEYNNLTVTRASDSGETISYNKSIVITEGFSQTAKSEFYRNKIKPVFEKYKASLTANNSLFEHELIPRKYSLMNFEDGNLQYYFRHNHVDFQTKDRSKSLLFVFEDGCQLSGGQKVGEEKTKPIENEAMRNVLQENNLTVYTYEDIWYRNITNNINLHLSSNEEGNLTFRYICLPGANTALIKQKIMAVTHFLDLDINENNLAIGKSFIDLKNLRAFQEVDGKETEVAVEFSSIETDGFTMKVSGSYDKAQPLIIELISKIK